jgi:MinD superfamily P-loop ATPase
MARVAQLAGHFRVPAMVCVNKFDLNTKKTEEIRAYAKEHNLIFLGEIPFDPVFTKAMVKGRTLFEYDSNSEAGRRVRHLWMDVGDVLGIDK